MKANSYYLKESFYGMRVVATATEVQVKSMNDGDLSEEFKTFFQIWFSVDYRHLVLNMIFDEEIGEEYTIDQLLLEYFSNKRNNIFHELSRLNRGLPFQYLKAIESKIEKLIKE